MVVDGLVVLRWSVLACLVVVWVSGGLLPWLALWWVSCLMGLVYVIRLLLLVVAPCSGVGSSVALMGLFALLVVGSYISMSDWLKPFCVALWRSLMGFWSVVFLWG